MKDSSIGVSADVLKTVINRWPEKGQIWSEHVEAELDRLCAQYRATPLRAFDARFSLVVEVATDDKRSLVMRSTSDPHGRFQASVAVTLARLGVAPRVHQVLETDTGTWTVMDRVLPGESLVDRAANLEELAKILRPMVGQPAPRPDMPSVADWLKTRLGDDDLDDRAPGRDIASMGERRSALTLLEDLTRGWTPVLCHGDVSSKNVLTATGGLLLIDPRGVSGEVSYDVAVVASKLARRHGLADGTAELADLVGADRDRALAWRVVATTARV